MKGEPCLICGELETSYLFRHEGSSIVQCSGCGLLKRTPFAGKTQFSLDEFDDSELQSETEAAYRYVAALLDAGVAPSRGSVLLVGVRHSHPLACLLSQYGFDVETVEHRLPSCAPGTAEERRQYGCIVLIEILEKVQNPSNLLDMSWALLIPDGVLAVISISLDSWSAKFFGRAWPGWRSENGYYFDKTTLQLLLEKQGFGKIRTLADYRMYPLEHVLQRAREYPKTYITKAISILFPVLPPALRQSRTRIASSRQIVTCVRKDRRSSKFLSIVMPVFNERKTFETTLRQVMAKSIEGVGEKEIIIVESRSTDGTREEVQRYEGHPGITIIYEEKPRGKGHAVRTGFKHAGGDIVMIQDADTEYDVNDYDALLKPILEHKKPFVLGTRFTGNWKMRSFEDDPGLAHLFNFGQVLFTWLMNTLYGQRMTDPFTMYKVFRKECIHGIKFECNRFDFDHELVIKLVRKGYVPFEVPVNYNSRSYSEGKKVTIFGDPLLWIKANFKYRFFSPFEAEFAEPKSGAGWFKQTGSVIKCAEQHVDAAASEETQALR